MSAKKQAPNNRGLPLLLVLGGGLLLIIVAVLIARGNSPAAPAPTTAAETQSANTQSDIPYPDVERVSLEDAKAAFDAGSAVFVDVRSADAYTMAHIAGAESMPVGDLGTLMTALDPGQWIITYCT
jgi:3-mercaptopyruvate sulfurtransferase SseA